jgi:hypothetical protein
MTATAAQPALAIEEDAVPREPETFAKAYNKVRRELKNYFSSTMVSDRYWRFINPRLQRLRTAAAKTSAVAVARDREATIRRLHESRLAMMQKAAEIACNGLFPEARLAAQEILDAAGDLS